MKGKSQCCLWLGVNAFAAYDLERPIAFGLICDGINADGGYIPVPLGYMRIISTRLMPRVCGIHRQKPKALGLKFGCGFTWHLSIKVLRLRECCGVPWRAFFFAVMGCSGLARTGIGPI